MKYLLFLIFSAAVFFSCKKEDAYVPIKIPCQLSRNVDTIQNNIQGRWIWLEELRYDRSGASYLTPKNQGFTRTIVLGGDEIARIYKNGALEVTYTYKILRQGEITGTSFPEDDDYTIAFFNPNTGIRASFVPLLICNNYMVLQFQSVSSNEGEQIWKKV